MTKPDQALSGDAMVRGRMLFFAMLGVVIVAGSILVARHYEVGRNIGFDFQGERVQGTAEPNDDGSYRLRYEEDGGIHARNYEGGFGLQRTSDETFDVTLAVNPDKPGRFQPAGLSYAPGAASLLIFCVGMACVLHARRIVMMHRRNR
jgi:hypothetical protein